MLTIDATQEAMRGFLDQKGVRALKGYYPEPPNEESVRAYEEYDLIGPNLDAPRVCLTQNLGGKWNTAVLEILTTAFISAVKQGKCKPVEHTWSQMQQEAVRKRCKTKLYSTQRKCITRPMGAASDKLNRMYSRRQDVSLCVVGSSRYSNSLQTYARRRKIYEVNHKGAGENDDNERTWDGVGLLLDALGTRGMSDDETDNESEHPNPDRRFKTPRRIDTGFLTPEIADIWAAVETYPCSAQISRGNRSYKRNSNARTTNWKRTPISGLPVNFYHPDWLRRAPPSFRSTVKGDVALPVLVSHNAFMPVRRINSLLHKVRYDVHIRIENMNSRQPMNL
jgi:hypothetical protein